MQVRIYDWDMERVCQISKSFEEADHYDRAQAKALTPNERLHIARRLQRRVFKEDVIDIKAWHRKK